MAHDQYVVVDAFEVVCRVSEWYLCCHDAQDAADRESQDLQVVVGHHVGPSVRVVEHPAAESEQHVGGQH